MGFGICAIAPCTKLAHVNAKSMVETRWVSHETRPEKPASRTAETASPDAVRPVEANESTGAVGKADERREVGNVIASVMDKVLKYSFFDAEILSPHAGALRHLWQNAPLHQPGKRVRAAFVKCAA
jgi:hypothetical protein